MGDKFAELLDSMSDEEKQILFESFEDKTPKGWVSIEDAVPSWLAKDIVQGYTIYKVKFNDGSEGESCVTDGSVWYYLAKEAGVTHWFNE